MELIVRKGGDLYNIWAEPPIQPLLKVCHCDHEDCHHHHRHHNHRHYHHISSSPLLPRGVRVQCDQSGGLARWQGKLESRGSWTICLQVIVKIVIMIMMMMSCMSVTKI